MSSDKPPDKEKLEALVWSEPLSKGNNYVVYKDPKEPNVYKFPLRNQNSIPLQEYIQKDMLHRGFNAFNPITVIENPL